MRVSLEDAGGRAGNRGAVSVPALARPAAGQAPATATPAVSSSVPRRPSEVCSTGNRKTPMKAPSLPTPAEIPCPVVRMLTGNSSLGSMNVVMFGRTR